MSHNSIFDICNWKALPFPLSFIVIFRTNIPIFMKHLIDYPANRVACAYVPASIASPYPNNIYIYSYINGTRSSNRNFQFHWMSLIKTRVLFSIVSRWHNAMKNTHLAVGVGGLSMPLGNRHRNGNIIILFSDYNVSVKILDCLIREFFFLFAIRSFHLGSIRRRPERRQMGKKAAWTM